MGSIWVREFTGGLDTRRLPETTPGGTLLTARNGHITRGGEFEQRAAIQKAYDLPPNTFGLAYQQGALFIFAETDPGGALDSDIGFFEIKHPDGITNPARVLSWDLFAGLIYASVRFADDSVYHFYNLNQRIDIWFDGKARASFTVTGGTDATASAAASGSFDITAVLSTGSVTVSHIYIGTKDLLASPVVFATSGGVSAVLDRGLLATALANAIAANSGSSGYTATAANSKVVVTATTAGPAPNRLEILPSYSTSEVTMTIGVMGGGTDALSGSVTSVKIDGVESLSAPVVYTGTPESMAAAHSAGRGRSTRPGGRRGWRRRQRRRGRQCVGALDGGADLGRDVEGHGLEACVMSCFGAFPFIGVKLGLFEWSAQCDVIRIPEPLVAAC